MKYGISHLSIIPGRSEPAESAELSTQLLFGEGYEIIEEKEKWTHIRCFHDGYECWVDRKQTCPVQEEKAQQLQEGMPSRVLDTSTTYQVGLNSPPLHLTKGAAIPELTTQCRNFSPALLAPATKLTSGKLPMDELPELARTYLGTPYLWGGRTPFGIDCSGFMQILFLLSGRTLSRDASDQVKEGDTVEGIGAIKSGDLAFFQNEKGNVTHVGILGQGNEIIHASGEVRNDQLVKDGIRNLHSGKITHPLHSIKRYK